MEYIESVVPQIHLEMFLFYYIVRVSTKILFDSIRVKLFQNVVDYVILFFCYEC